MRSGVYILRGAGVVAMVVALALWPSHVAAQSTGLLKGRVTDTSGKPLEGVKISIDYLEGVTRHHETKTNKKGEFIQIGIYPGQYRITAEKEGYAPLAADRRVRLGDATEIAFTMQTGEVAAAGGPEAAKKAGELKRLFDEGVAATKTNNPDAAIESFKKAIEIMPSCPDCYYNLGYAHTQKKDYDPAEQAFKKAIELKTDYAEAYNGLAGIYNAQKKFDQASAASAKASQLQAGAAGGGGSAHALYNEGVILWNAGKIPDAKAKFEEAVKADPTYADAHYQLGMALVNEGKLPEASAEFETYLKLAPTGSYAEQAKGILVQIKK